MIDTTTNNEKAAEAFKLYEAMGEARSLRKLAEQTGIGLSKLGQWSSDQGWKERLEHPTTSNPTTSEQRTITDLEQEQSALRVQVDKDRAHLETMQRALAAKLSAQRAMYAARAPLVETAHAHQKAVTAAQEALSRHINTATESVYADKLYEVEQAHTSAQEELTAFDQAHAHVSVATLQAERDAIVGAEQALEQQRERLRTLSAEILQAGEQASRTALERILTAYQDLYAVLEKDGPMLDRLRKHAPVFYYHLLPRLLIDLDQLAALIDPGPFLKDRQATISTYLAQIATDKPLE